MGKNVKKRGHGGMGDGLKRRRQVPRDSFSSSSSCGMHVRVCAEGRHGESFSKECLQTWGKEAKYKVLLQPQRGERQKRRREGRDREGQVLICLFQARAHMLQARQQCLRACKPVPTPDTEREGVRAWERKKGKYKKCFLEGKGRVEGW